MVEPSGYTSLGLIGYTDRGAYSPAANYVKNDLVHYGGSVWRVLVDDTTNITPTEGANYTIFISDPTTNISNRNLIDNAWFTVNQRGFVSGAPNGYCVDRWKTTSANMTVAVVNGGGITLTSATAQTEIVNQLESDLRDRLLGRTLTFSVMLSDGSILSDTFALPSSLPGSTTSYSDIDLDANFEARVAISAHGAKPLYVHIRTNANVSSSASITIKAVKLEIGTLSTLGEDTIPDYAFELAKCQTSTADSADTYSNMGNIVVSEQLDNEVTARSRLGAHNLLDITLEELKSINTNGSWNDNVYTRLGNTFTVNDDMSITVNTTANESETSFSFALKRYAANSDENPFVGKEITYSGCPSGGSSSTVYGMFRNYSGTSLAYDYGSGVTFTPEKNVSNEQLIVISIGAGYTGANDVVFKPMIRLAEDASPEYGPYTKTNQELTDDINSVNSTLADEVETRSTNGAHNLFNTTITTQTDATNGVIITKNTDGKVTVAAVNGTASTNSSAVYYTLGEFSLPVGDYIVSGISQSVDDATNGKVYLQLYDVDTGTTILNIYNPSSIRTFSVPSPTKKYRLRIRVSATSPIPSAQLLEPMICLASDPDTSYAPFAMTNQQLTENKGDKSDLTSINITGSTNNTGATITSGTFFYLNGTLVKAKTDIANGATLTADTNYNVVTVGGLNELISEKTTTLYNNQITFVKVGRVVSFYGEISNLTSADTSAALGNLPEEFRPYLEYALLPLYKRSSTPYEPNGSVWIKKSNGSFTVYKSSGITNGYVSGTYVTA